MAAKRRKKAAPEPIDTRAMENALWLMGLARRPGVIVRLELDTFPPDYRSRWRA